MERDTPLPSSVIDRLRSNPGFAVPHKRNLTFVLEHAKWAESRIFRQRRRIARMPSKPLCPLRNEQGGPEMPEASESSYDTPQATISLFCDGQVGCGASEASRRWRFLALSRVRPRGSSMAVTRLLDVCQVIMACRTLTCTLADNREPVHASRNARDTRVRHCAFKRHLGRCPNTCPFARG